LVARIALALVALAATDKLPVRPPKSVGMSAERLATINRVVKRGVDAGGYPGAAVVVGRQGAAVFEKGFGHLGWTKDSPSVSADNTVYDLASLTKVIGTATAAMVLYDEGRLDLDAPVARYLPAFWGEGKDRVTVRHLLTHRSGLPAGRELWRLASNPTDAKRIVLETPLVCAPGDCFIYSDLGADVMAWVVESIAGQGIDTFLHERVFGPLGMNDTYFNPPDSVAYRVAPTEVAPPRGYPLKGQVHDENAYALGGVAGHAGLFSTASDLAVFAQMMLNHGEYDGQRIVSDSAVAVFTRRTAGTRALGWDTADGDGGSGEYLSERAFGHTGYTGTSIWIDPDRETFVILLTNRVHAARARHPAKVIADVRADLADAAALAVVQDVDNVMDMPAKFRADRATGWNTPVRRRPVRRKASTKRRTTTSKAKPTAKRAPAKAKKPD
jgi:serine-type D-Ala-D-Ala carboxypeptidase